MGEELGDTLRTETYDVAACWTLRGEVRGVWGLRKMMARGELGAEVGVSGRGGLRRTEWEEAREEGREIGRRVGVR